MSHKVVLLDRDGVINVDRGYVGRVDQWTTIDGAIDAICVLKEAGFLAAVASNQSGVAQGLLTEDDVWILHDHLQQLLAQRGAVLDAAAYCFHAKEEECCCRKPKTGLAAQIEEQLGQTIDRANSWMIGDKRSDVEFGRKLGVKTALLKSPYWNDEKPPTGRMAPDLVCVSFLDAANAVT